MAPTKTTKTMNTTKYHVRITFTTPVLGTQPTKDVATKYIGEKFKDNGGELPEDEVETLPDMVEKGTTAFHRLNDKPILYDYQVKGFLKEAGRIFNGLHGVKNLKSKIENLVFVYPRRIPLVMPEGAKIEHLERPLRAETAQGPRTALARSEMIPEGTHFDIELEVYDGEVTEEILRDLFTYGARKGLGQWRNGSYGRIEFEFNRVAK